MHWVKPNPLRNVHHPHSCPTGNLTHLSTAVFSVGVTMTRNLFYWRDQCPSLFTTVRQWHSFSSTCSSRLWPQETIVLQVWWYQFSFIQVWRDKDMHGPCCSTEVYEHDYIPLSPGDILMFLSVLAMTCVLHVLKEHMVTLTLSHFPCLPFCH